MQLIQLIWSDFKVGTKRNIPKLIVTIIFTCLCCGFLYQNVNGKIHHGELQTLPGVYDFALYIFGGMKRYTESERHLFHAPVIWMGVQLLIASCIFSYPTGNLSNQGCSVLLQYRDRRKWWFEKNLWTLIQVIVVYACIWMGILVCTMLFGNMSNLFSEEITQLIHAVKFEANGSIAVGFVIIPVVHSTMAALCQINMSLLVSPIYSITVIVAFQLLSAYVQSDFLLGNASMLLRQNIYVEGGVHTFWDMGFELVLGAFAMVVGVIYVKKKDIL